MHNPRSQNATVRPARNFYLLACGCTHRVFVAFNKPKELAAKKRYRRMRHRDMDSRHVRLSLQDAGVENVTEEMTARFNRAFAYRTFNLYTVDNTSPRTTKK